jgi:DNA-directed RNA polymerase alpha subunit
VSTGLFQFTASASPFLLSRASAKRKPARRADGKARVEALARATRPIFQGSLEKAWFDHRGLSKRTVEAIVACGIYEPERLLFMTEEQLANIPGIGKVSMSEIKAYRDGFLK